MRRSTKAANETAPGRDITSAGIRIGETDDDSIAPDGIPASAFLREGPRPFL
jgi:hypothetical protein